MGNSLEKKEASPVLLLGQVLVDNLITGRFIGESSSSLVDENALSTF